MPPDGPLQLGIAAESGETARQVAALADRVIGEALAESGQDWFEGAARDGARRWRGLSEPQSFHDLHDNGAPGQRLRLHGFAAGRRSPDTLLFRRTLLRFQLHATPPVAAVVIARDSDGDRDLQSALQVAATDTVPESGWAFDILLAGAHPESEAWLLCGFEAQSPAEEACLAGLRQRLGFSPVETPEQLRGGRDDAPKNCKGVWRELTSGDVDRCLNAPLATLRRRGEGCGLAPFLAKVRTHIAERLGASDRPTL